MRRVKIKFCVLKVVFTLTLLMVIFSLSISAIAEEKWASGVKIRFFCGGLPGDAFASILHKGAMTAAEETGADVEYIFSGWNVEKIINQLTEAIAAKPDGISVVGHPGNDAILPLAKEASENGILLSFHNVDVPKAREMYGGGYIGAILEPQGYALGEEAIKLLGLKAGDKALVWGPWGKPGRSIREGSTAKAFEDAGLIVTKLLTPEGMQSDPSLIVDMITAQFLKEPETKVIVYAGGQTLGAAEMYMKAIGKKPGEVFNIGFDTSPAIIDAFEKGYVQLTSDQQPFLQGYLSVLSLCLTKVYGFAPIYFDTGKGFVNMNNYEGVAEWATKGYR